MAASDELRQAPRGPEITLAKGGGYQLHSTGVQPPNLPSTHTLGPSAHMSPYMSGGIRHRQTTLHVQQ